MSSLHETPALSEVVHTISILENLSMISLCTPSNITKHLIYKLNSISNLSNLLYLDFDYIIMSKVFQI
jgi:hypothetical protein